MTYSTLSTQLDVTQGSLNTTTQKDKWLRFKLDGKELIVSKVGMRSGISWDHLYSKGLVYGTNDNGLNPTGTPTNQLRTVEIQGKTYKVRLLKGADTDPFATNTIGYDFVGSQESEWSRIFYPIITNDPNIKSYTGPMLANYTEADLQMRWIDAGQTPGNYNWCQERHLYGTNYRVFRGYLGPSYLNRNTSSNTSVIFGWRPCLELIS